MSLSGFDLSNHNYASATVDKGLSGDFVIVKASEGLSYRDPYHHQTIARARDLGRLCGHYHYPWPKNDVAAEVGHFLSYASPQPGDVLALDFEPYRQAGLDVPVIPTWVPGWVLSFLSQVNDATGCSCWLYLNGDWGSRLMAAATPAQRVLLCTSPLWKATQGASTPGIMWGWQNLTCWQWDASGGLDKDVFYGDAATWRKLGVAGGDEMVTSTEMDAIANRVWRYMNPDTKVSGGRDAYSHLLSADKAALATDPVVDGLATTVGGLADQVADVQAQVATSAAQVDAIHGILSGLDAAIRAYVTEALTAALASISVEGTYSIGPKAPTP